MGLLRIIAVGVLGYAGYKVYEANKATGSPPAFADGEAGGENFAKVRNAGPESMHDTPGADWDAADQASDESFPASDPPGTY